ncbi:Inactive pancreatic lipase- protein 1 [Bulinus truncatus]|nr:Inactive pancreatic lipase- protein 1 [Bulinus truncatus]
MWTLGVFIVVVLCCGCCQSWLVSNWWTPCYSDPPVGCFPSGYPFNNSGGFYPQSPDTINIRFHLYSRRQNVTVSLGNTLQDVQTSYNASLNTVIIIHGYLEGPDEIWIRELTTELLRRNDTNVFTLDWYDGANSFFYYQSVANARVVGAVLSLFIQELVALGSQPSSFHLVGFSLGAHVAGYAGSRIAGIARITGLDPAGISFEDTPPEVRLDPTDAILVDVIHTDSSPGLGMGTFEPMGTVDFYVNGGADQPGCANSVMGRVSAFFETIGLGFDSVRTAVGCSHMRATQLFARSVNNNCSWVTYICPNYRTPFGQQCSPCHVAGQCHVMGYGSVQLTGQQSLGTYYRIDTPQQSPFCCKYRTLSNCHCPSGSNTLICLLSIDTVPVAAIH